MAKVSRRELLRLSGIAGLAAVAAACTPQVVKETVLVEKPVEKVVEKEVTKVVEKEVTKVVKEVVKETVVVEGTPKVIEKTVEKIVTVQPAPGGPMVITFCDSQAFGSPHFHFTQTPIAVALSEKAQEEGLNVELQVLIMDDPRIEYPLMYAAGSHFTFAFDAQWYHMIPNVQQGYLLPLEDLFAEYGPNITKAVGGEGVLELNYMYDHLYGLPTGGPYKAGTGIIIRDDLRKKYGLPVPGPHFEDVEPFLEAVAKNEPDVIPFVADKTQQVASGRLHLIGPERRYSPWGNAHVEFTDVLADDLELVDDETDERWMDAIQLARRWYEKGWINKNALQLQQPAVHELFTPGKGGALGFQEPAQKRYDVQMALSSFVPDGETYGWDTTGLVTGEVKYLAMRKVWNFIVFHSKVPREETVAGVKFFDWLLADQDNIDIWLYGIDGVNHHLLPDMRYEPVEGVDGATNYFRKWYSGGVPMRFIRFPKDADEAYVTEVNALADIDNFIINPVESFEFDTKPVETELAQMAAAADATQIPLNIGMVDPEEGLAAYTKALNDAGRQKVKEEVQKQFEEWQAKQ